MSSYVVEVFMWKWTFLHIAGLPAAGGGGGGLPLKSIFSTRPVSGKNDLWYPCCNRVHPFQCKAMNALLFTCTFIYLATPSFFPLMHGRLFNLSTSIQIFPEVRFSLTVWGETPLVCHTGSRSQASYGDFFPTSLQIESPPICLHTWLELQTMGTSGFIRPSDKQQCFPCWMQQIEIGLVTKHSQTIRLRSGLLAACNPHISITPTAQCNLRPVA